MRIESEQLKAGIVSRIVDLDVEIKKDRKEGIFRSENDVRREELVNFVLYVIEILERLEAGAEIDDLKGEING